MATETQTIRPTALIDKAWLRQKFAEKDTRDGFTVDHSVTPQQVREQMQTEGVHPEDNVFSRELLRERYDEE